MVVLGVAIYPCLVVLKSVVFVTMGVIVVLVVVEIVTMMVGGIMIRH